MKKILCFISLLSLSFVAFAQPFASLTVIVLDKETKKLPARCIYSDQGSRLEW